MAEFSNRFEGITGSAIRQIFAYLSIPDMISLAGGNPSPETFPASQLAALAEKLLREQGEWVLQYGATRGVGDFIQYLRDMSTDTMRPDDDLITLTGSSQGIDLFARTMLNDGDIVLTEAPTFLGATQTFRLAGGKLVSVPLEDDGVNIDVLEEKIRQYRPKFFYTMPTFQNPTGVTACLEKRKAVYRICAENDVFVLEDDPYGMLRFEGEHLPSIKSFDDGHHVTRLSSFSKTISPGLRVGYAVGPKDVIQKMELLKQGADVHTPNLSQELVMEYLKSGEFDAHVREVTDLYRNHRDAMLEVLDEMAPAGTTYTRPEGGFFLWVHLPGDLSSQKLFDLCLEKKVVFVPGTPFYVDGGHENTLRLNFSMPTAEQIHTGTRRLCEAISEGAAGGK